MKTPASALVARLNRVCRAALDAAAESAHQRTNFSVEVEHLCFALLESDDTDFARILRHFDVPPESALDQLGRAIDGFSRGNGRLPAISEHLLDLLEGGWLASSLRLESGEIRSGALLMAILDSRTLAGAIRGSCPALLEVLPATLASDFLEIRSPREEPGGASGAPASPGPAGEQNTPALDRYTIDLTEKARLGQLDPINGRDSEIRQIIDILSRRRQNNPILAGEAGVGKTAVVEGFAQRVFAGRVPGNLQHAVVRSLDLGLLQAGAGMRGEFEERVKTVIEEVKESDPTTILFIDEAHSLIGAGGGEGRGDAANLLKPALARGELRTIAATTWAEYKRYFESDAALARRFQVVRVGEPDEESAIEMLRGVVPRLEEHHDVRLLEDSVQAAVRLSHRYIIGRRLPDKAISVLDTAAARVAVAQGGEPLVLEEASRRVASVRAEISILEREDAEGNDPVGQRIRELRMELLSVSEEEALVKARYDTERKLVDKLRSIRNRISSAPTRDEHDPDEIESWVLECAQLEERLDEVQGDEPMIPLAVTAREVAAVISSWTGVPTGKVMAEELEVMLNLEDRLADRVVGQGHALDCIANRIRAHRSGLDDPTKPVGVFLLAGPSGVGKTETALALADTLYGGDRSLITVNMSEYQEAHSVSKLKGAPAGYVGYGKGGVLTEAVRQRPYSVVLLDEIEKAHPDVRDLFYQVFDKGVMEDSEGQIADFRNTVILLTSNLGAHVLASEVEVDEDGPTRLERLRGAVWVELEETLTAAYLGRLVVIPYMPLSPEVIRNVSALKLQQVMIRLERVYGAAVEVGDGVVDELTRRCSRAGTGARDLDHIISQTLLPDLARRLLGQVAEGHDVKQVEITVGEDGSFSNRVMTVEGGIVSSNKWGLE